MNEDLSSWEKLAEVATERLSVSDSTFEPLKRKVVSKFAVA
jgi:hypothetical protein